MEIENEQLPDETIRELAGMLHERGFALPAMMVLEMYRPLLSLGSVGLMASAPLFIPIFGRSFYQTALSLISSPDALQRLIDELENRLQNHSKLNSGCKTWE